MTTALARSPNTLWRLHQPEVEFNTLVAIARRVTLENLVQATDVNTRLLAVRPTQVAG